MGTAFSVSARVGCRVAARALDALAIVQKASPCEDSCVSITGNADHGPASISPGDLDVPAWRRDAGRMVLGKDDRPRRVCRTATAEDVGGMTETASRRALGDSLVAGLRTDFAGGDHKRVGPRARQIPVEVGQGVGGVSSTLGAAAGRGPPRAHRAPLRTVGAAVPAAMKRSSFVELAAARCRRMRRAREERLGLAARTEDRYAPRDGRSLTRGAPVGGLGRDLEVDPWRRVAPRRAGKRPRRRSRRASTSIVPVGDSHCRGERGARVAVVLLRKGLSTR